MKFSILRVDEVLPNLRVRSMHSPEKKDSTISAIAEGASKEPLGWKNVETFTQEWSS
jgi:hypothetical protein